MRHETIAANSVRPAMEDSYKFMLLDHRNHLVAVRESVHENADLACEQAKTIFAEAQSHAIEVWRGSRFICIVDENGMRFTLQ
jgi:hypothetical protein